MGKIYRLSSFSCLCGASRWRWEMSFDEISNIWRIHLSCSIQFIKYYSQTIQFIMHRRLFHSLVRGVLIKHFFRNFSLWWIFKFEHVFHIQKLTFFFSSSKSTTQNAKIRIVRILEIARKRVNCSVVTFGRLVSLKSTFLAAFCALLLCCVLSHTGVSSVMEKSWACSTTLISIRIATEKEIFHSNRICVDSLAARGFETGSVGASWT